MKESIYKKWRITCLLVGLLTAGPVAGQEVSLKESVSGHKGLFPYTHPGIVTYKSGRWIGNDHLYNLSSDIHVFVKIALPKGFSGTIKGDLVRSQTETILRKSGINPLAHVGSVEEVLPFLEVMIQVVPVGEQLVTNVVVRLFESVSLSRVVIQGGVAWQGITWEKQKLIISPESEHEIQTKKAVEGLTKDFVKRFLFYQKLKAYRKEKR